MGWIKIPDNREEVILHLINLDKEKTIIVRQILTGVDFGMYYFEVYKMFEEVKNPWWTKIGSKKDVLSLIEALKEEA